MADSQSTPQIEARSLSLPKGGGAIRGLGETFSPDEFSGTAVLSIPLPVMPCRDFAPALAINYSSGAGNGPFGLGFSLATPSISRATNRGTPRYDGGDHFVIEGNNYLVPLDGGSRTETLRIDGQSVAFRVQRYAPRQVGDFALIEYWQTQDQDEAQGDPRSFWKVTAADHTISIFGWSPSARVSNPDAPAQVFSWLLEETYDVAGDHQLYHYIEENTQNVDTARSFENNRLVGAQRYLSHVRYGNDRPIAGSILMNAAAADAADGGSEADPNQPDWHFEVVFNYGQYTLPPENRTPYTPTGEWTCRPDPFSTYEPGFEVRTYRRCQSVLFFNKFKELGPEPVLTGAVRLRYADITAANGYLSQIVGVTDTGYRTGGPQALRGHGGPQAQGYRTGGPRARGRSAAPEAFEELSYPELELSYTTFQPAGRTFESLNAATGNLNGLEGGGYSLVDLYGQGIPGVLYADGQSVLYRQPQIAASDASAGNDDVRSTGDTHEPASFAARAALAHDEYRMQYGAWRVPATFPIPRVAEGAGVALADHTGDGRLDLQLQQPGQNGYWQARADGSWTDFRAFDRYPADAPAPNQTSINAIGAGLSDLLQIRDTRNYVYPNARAAGYDPALSAARESSMPSTLESSASVKLQFADMAGSGTPQFVKIEANRVRYWPNLSYGRFAAPVEMAGAPDFNADQFSVGFQSERLFLADVDGSGTADLVYVDARAAYVYLNQSGNEFAPPLRIELPHTFDALDQISFADVYGQGTTCMIVSYPHGLPDGADTRPAHLAYDFCGRSKPYLLNRSANNLGGATEIEYASSVDYYLRDLQAGRPWITGLPFPVQVIAQSTVHDLLTGSRYTSLYAYHDGYYDGAEREFKGFGRVDRQDSEYLPPGAQPDEGSGEYVAPALSRTWYDVGCFEHNEALMKQYRSEYYRGDDAALPLPENFIDCDPADADTLAQAHAALAGSVLRNEVYGLQDRMSQNPARPAAADAPVSEMAAGAGLEEAGTADGVPYTVVCSSYTVRTIQPKGDNRYGVFFIHGREDHSYAYDRNPIDPRVEQQFTLQVDEYGNVERSAAVSYPRRKPLERKGGDAARIEDETLKQQEQWRVFCSTTDFINHAEPERYQIGVAYASRSYSLPQAKPTGDGFTFAEIARQVEGALQTLSAKAPTSDRARLQSWGRTIFAEVTGDGETRALEPGEVQLPALVYQQAGAVDTSANIAAVYAGALDANELKTRLEQGFFRYDAETDYWWNDSARATYHGADHFYLTASTVTPATDPDDQTKITASVTSYAYDAYDLLMTAVTDAYGNRARIEDVDYRTMQPDRMIDANETTTEALLDPLGQVIYTSVYGYENGEPVGFDSVTAAPTEHAPDAAAVIADPEKYLGRMQSYFYYDFRAFVDRGQPVGALSLTAINYPDAAKTARIQTELPPIEISVTYADGLGRELQTKARVEAGEAFLYNKADGTLSTGHADQRWLTTGRTFYNNKGEPIKQYEPYFIDTPACVTNATLDTVGSGTGGPQTVRGPGGPMGHGFSSTLYYDPIGRLTKTLTPKGFLVRSEYSPWHTTAWDQNDSIKESPYYRDNIEHPPQPGEAGGPYFDPDLSEAGKDNLRYVAKYFADTPTTSLVDNLGNDIVAQRINQYPADLNDPMAGDPVRDELYDYMQYDESGRQLRSSDPRLSQSGIYNFEMYYVMAGDSPLKTISVDAGTSWILPNALGSPVFSYDSRGVAITTEYDLLQRPVASRVKKTTTQGQASSADDPLVIDQVVGRVVYGDSPDSGAPAKHNMVGQPYRTFDSAGMVETASYGLGGEPLAGQRRFFKDYKTQGNWDDVRPIARERLLQHETYTSSAHFDALGRVIESRDSDANLSFPEYHIGGALNKVAVLTADDGGTTQYVNGISYNAMGQRLEMNAGNGMTTEYFYDPRTHATTRTRTLNTKKQTLQDVAYEYDPVGNVFRKELGSEEQVIFNQEKVEPVAKYLFDALYQLIQATGREKIGNGQQKGDPDLPVTPNIPHENDLKALHNYIERYSYDRGGNRTRTEHRAFGHKWTRDMVVSSSSNRAVNTRINGEPDHAPTPEQVDDFFDAHGNQVKLRTAHPLAWDYANQLQSVTIVERQVGAADGEDGQQGNVSLLGKSDVEYYVYDGGGQRVRKINETYAFGGKTVTVRETLYLGGIEIRRTSRGADPESATVQNEYHSLRIMDDESGVATRDHWTKGDPPGDFQNPSVIYHLQDNLNSYTTQVNDAGEIIAREEYAPFGESTFFAGVGGADELTHYRYSGQERDNATGFYYYGARYYATWLGRWLSPDPAGTIDGPNLYAFVSNNPVTMVDVGGMAETQVPKIAKKPIRKSKTKYYKGGKRKKGALTSPGVPAGLPLNDMRLVNLDQIDGQMRRILNTSKEMRGKTKVQKQIMAEENNFKINYQGKGSNQDYRTTVEQAQEGASDNLDVNLRLVNVSHVIGTHAVRAGNDGYVTFHSSQRRRVKRAGKVFQLGYTYRHSKTGAPAQLIRKLTDTVNSQEKKNAVVDFLEDLVLRDNKTERYDLLELHFSRNEIKWIYKFASIQFMEKARIAKIRASNSAIYHQNVDLLERAFTDLRTHTFSRVYATHNPRFRGAVSVSLMRDFYYKNH